MNLSAGCYSFAVIGGLLAQVPDQNVGTAGILIGVTGLLGGLTSAGKMYLDWRLKMREMDIEDLKKQLAATREELTESRENAHRRANATNDILMDVQEKAGRNSNTLKALVPVAKELADRSGVLAAIPEPGTATDIRTIQ